MHLLAKILVAPLVFVLSLGGYTVVQKEKIDTINQQITSLQEQLEEQKENLIVGADTTLPVNGATYSLAGSGVSSSATSINLASFTIPQSGYKIQDYNLSDTFYMTLEPGNRTRQEVVSCTTVTQNASGSATLSGCTRGLSPISPYTASSTIQFAHAGGTSVILGDAAQLFNQYGAKGNDETVTGEWTFSTPPHLTGTATSTDQAASISYVNGVAIQGAATSTFSAMGIVRLAKGEDVRQGIGTSTNNGGEPLVIPSILATSSPQSMTGGRIPSTRSNGTISPVFIATSSTDVYNSAASTTVTGSTYFSGSVTLNGGIKIATSTTAGLASSSPITIDSVGNVRLMQSGYAMGNAYQPANTTGNQVITHNLGRTPYYIEITAKTLVSGSYGGQSFCNVTTSTGFSTSTASQYSVWDSYGFNSSYGASVGYASTSPSRIIYHVSAAGGANGIAASASISAITSTTFTLNWDVNAATATCPGATDRNFIWKAY